MKKVDWGRMGKAGSKEKGAEKKGGKEKEVRRESEKKNT